MSECSGVYLRRSCPHLPTVTPVNYSAYGNGNAYGNYSDYGNYSEEMLTVLANGDVVQDPSLAELLHVSEEIRQKVNELEILVVSAANDQQLLMGEFAKEKTCPALEQFNYTCPTVFCPQVTSYKVTLECDYGPMKIALALVGLLALAWRKRV